MRGGPPQDGCVAKFGQDVNANPFGSGHAFGALERGNDLGQGTAFAVGRDRGRNFARDFRLAQAEDLSDVHRRGSKCQRGHKRARGDRTGEKCKPKHRVYRVERIRSPRSKGNANRELAKIPAHPWCFSLDDPASPREEKGLLGKPFLLRRPAISRIVSS